MEPVKSSATSNSCGETIGSSCVEWAGGNLCSTDLCRGNTTLTDVITAMDRTICGSTIPAYTGNWVDFSTDIPASGSGGGVTWTIGSFGFGNIGTTENRPMYKFTKDGDLSLRGTLLFNGVTTINTSFFAIPLTTINPSLFPSNFNASQSIMVQVSCYSMNANKTLDFFFESWATLIYPTGELRLVNGYSTIPGGIFNGIVISFGGSRFNLA